MKMNYWNYLSLMKITNSMRSSSYYLNSTTKMMKNCYWIVKRKNLNLNLNCYWNSNWRMNYCYLNWRKTILNWMMNYLNCSN